MNSPLLKISDEGKTVWDTTTSEFEEPKEDISWIKSSYVLKDLIENWELINEFKESKEDISWIGTSYILKDLIEDRKPFRINKEILKFACILLTSSFVALGFEDDAFQTLVKENPLKNVLPKIIPTQIALIKIKAYKEEVKKKIEKRNKEEYEKLEKLSLKPFDV